MMAHATLGQPIDRRRHHHADHATPAEAGNVHLDLIGPDRLVLLDGYELLGALLLLAVFAVLGIVTISIAMGYGWANFVQFVELWT
jgi:hypothetical protein